MPITRRLTAFIFAAALAGCATTATRQPDAAPGAATSAAAYRDSIELAGRLSANYQQDGQPGSVTVNFEWSQQPGRIDVTLAAPTGQTVAMVKVTPDEATLTQANRRRRARRRTSTP
ncbi:lipoprotein insertase outer membrane protein LolB [Massilia sp. Se16.2.3]|uniref:lipoprotein insertase outer membrane protein LolB n=1 Tax=Massilia sp. Se16.2.3 TaxID=2709303 RepID=UPI00227716A1|nr:lipoprotein insertase outer membrane protein LolB [Massilia sp. Se16.2.3]